MTTLISTPRPTEREGSASEVLRLDAISDHEWRVIDTRYSEHDASCVVGFVEALGSEYEALVIGRGCERRRFSSLLDATGFISRSLGNAVDPVL
ncbi:hypothetical protein [Glutamicibacter endophyticus]|uniref:hypothetical protein n=1 Tax=Glutamicibacter endophyticus TaxID=1522174 RepID=UPI003AF177B7